MTHSITSGQFLLPQATAGHPLKAKAWSGIRRTETVKALGTRIASHDDRLVVYLL